LVGLLPDDPFGVSGYCDESYGGESGIAFRPISEFTATTEKSVYPFAIADTFRIAAMKFDGG
jgi:hypothetical protein